MPLFVQLVDDLPDVAIHAVCDSNAETLDAAHEKSGWSGLKHSYHMVRGRWWQFCGRLVVLYVFMILGLIVLSIPSAFVPESYTFNVLSMVPIDLLAAFAIVCFTELWLRSEPHSEELSDENVAAAT